VGETAIVSDYVSPPRVISSEKTDKEVTWSMGEYMSGRDVWKAFGLEGSPPERVGVYENQPSPFGAEARTIWLIFAGFLTVMIVMIMGFSVFARNEQVFQVAYSFNPKVGSEASLVTDIFELKGRTADVELTTEANVDNNWIYLNYALINEDNGQAFDFGREVSYFHGRDEDGPWSEGKQSDRVVIPSVPAGHYYLRIEPESDPGKGVIVYTISARRDVTQASFFWLALLSLLLPAGFLTWRSLNFEHLRWAESDYAPVNPFHNDDSDDPNRPITLGNLSRKDDNS
jgi:hypothetical protein